MANCILSTLTFTHALENLINAIGMQRRQWDYTVFNDAEEETEVTKLSQNNFFFFTVGMYGLVVLETYTAIRARTSRKQIR